MSLLVVAAGAGCGPRSTPPAPPAPSSSGSPGDDADPWQADGDAPVAGGDVHRPRPPAPEPPRDDRPAPRGLGGLPAAAQAMLASHNRYRARHCAAPLTWSPRLAEVAQAWANTLAAKGCAFGHSRGGSYGENLAAGTTGAMDPGTVVAMWYDEVALYAFDRPGFSMQTGHFTQVVWRGTTQLGCGVVQCKGMDVWVCNYDPPGNWADQYKQHVLPQSCKP